MAWLRKLLHVAEKQMITDFSNFVMQRIAKWEDRINKKEAVYNHETVIDIKPEVVEPHSNVVKITQNNIETVDVNNSSKEYGPHMMAMFAKAIAYHAPTFKSDPAHTIGDQQESADVIRLDFVGKNKHEPDWFDEFFEAKLHDVDVNPEYIKKIMHGIKDRNYYNTLPDNLKRSVDIYFKHRDKI